MPDYDFHCQKCGKKFSKRMSFEEYERRKFKCPQCGSEQVKQEVAEVGVKTSKKS